MMLLLLNAMKPWADLSHDRQRFSSKVVFWLGGEVTDAWVRGKDGGKVIEIVHGWMSSSSSPPMGYVTVISPVDGLVLMVSGLPSSEATSSLWMSVQSWTVLRDVAIM